jgi:hypothetical protein
MKKTSWIIALGTSVFLCHGATAATWYVDASLPSSGSGTTWEAALKTVQEGIDAASDGDTVIVAEETYFENIRFSGKNTALTSTAPLDPTVVANTIIDARQAGPVVAFVGTEDETCVLAGFTLRGGKASSGGGILGCGTRATIRTNVITGNSAAYYGGGVYSCNGIIGNNVIAGNSAREGGGLNLCHGIIQNNTISDNTCRWNGGGLCLCNGVIRNNIISQNSSPDYGRGGGLWGCDGVIHGNAIRNNSAADDGGGLFRCNGTVENNLVTGNSAVNSGGGLFRCEGAIQNNTITGNIAGKSGGGVHWSEGPIRNCIIWGNSAPQGPQIDVSASPSFCCIQDWQGGGDGNIADDPAFTDPAGGDYHLRANSPCVGAGVRYYWFVWPQRDLDGNCRLAGSEVDMGCYEYGATQDSDGDLLSDSAESERGTNPEAEDTDGDGLRDGLELLRGSDPVIPMSPGTIYIASDTPTIQQALCLAVSGDEIVVVPGRYEENIQFCGPDVVLRSVEPENTEVVASTVLNGSGLGPVVSFTGNESKACVLTGLTITGGFAGHGAGIRGGTPDHRTHATIRHNVICNNSTGLLGEGGGVAYCGGEILNNTVSENSARHGGGLFGCNGEIHDNLVSENSADDRGGGLAHCDGLIRDNVVSGNSAESGGGLADCTDTIRNNTIFSNIAYSDGGGLAGCSASVQSNTITGNLAYGDGGGLSFCSGHIQCNTISGNLAYDDGGGLGGCDGLIENNAISDNSAVWSGGGLYRCGGAVRSNLVVANRAEWSGGGFGDCDGDIQNNTVVANSANYWGGGLSLCNGTIRSCIIWGNTAANDPQLYYSQEPTNSCVQSWTEGGEGNTVDDPRFVIGSYRLQDESPCIDAGFNEDWMLDAVDLDGNPRISNGTVDMGAYEYGSFAFRIVGVVHNSDGEPELTWNSRPGDSYTIWSCANLLTGVWIEDATISSQGETTSWTDPDATSPQKFYRIEIK